MKFYFFKYQHVDEPEEDDEVESTTTTTNRKILQNGFNKSHGSSTKVEHHQDNMSDNLSGVSMGTSSLSSDTVSCNTVITIFQ